MLTEIGSSDQVSARMKRRSTALNSSACVWHLRIRVLSVPSLSPMRKAVRAASLQGLADRSASHSAGNAGSSCSATFHR
jgi:hypothetical protein